MHAFIPKQISNQLVGTASSEKIMYFTHYYSPVYLCILYYILVFRSFKKPIDFNKLRFSFLHLFNAFNQIIKIIYMYFNHYCIIIMFLFHQYFIILAIHISILFIFFILLYLLLYYFITLMFKVQVFRLLLYLSLPRLIVCNVGHDFSTYFILSNAFRFTC